jgi:hypothetical protein
MHGMESSDLVGPDFGSLTGGVHHMRDPLVSDSKSGKVRVRKVRGSSSCMHGLDGERVNARMHSVAGVRLTEGYLSKFRGEIIYSKPCLDIRESPKT